MPTEPTDPSQVNLHKVNGLNEAISVTAIGEPGPGGAFHEYLFLLDPHPDAPAEETRTDTKLLLVQFQNGPIKEPKDCNGWTSEAFLAMLIHRTEGFCKGPFPHPKNDEALFHLKAALQAFQDRTKERLARGVEGSLQK